MKKFEIYIPKVAHFRTTREYDIGSIIFEHTNVLPELIEIGKNYVSISLENNRHRRKIKKKTNQKILKEKYPKLFMNMIIRLNGHELK